MCAPNPSATRRLCARGSLVVLLAALVSPSLAAGDEPRGRRRRPDATESGTAADVDSLDAARTELEVFRARLVSRGWIAEGGDPRSIDTGFVRDASQQMRRMLERGSLDALYALGERRFVESIDQRLEAVAVEAQRLGGRDATQEALHHLLGRLVRLARDVEEQAARVLAQSASGRGEAAERARCRLAARAASVSLRSVPGAEAAWVALTDAILAAPEVGLAHARTYVTRRSAEASADVGSVLAQIDRAEGACRASRLEESASTH